MVSEISLITHAHEYGVNGAILQATAVKWGLQYPENDKSLLEELEICAQEIEKKSTR